MAFGQIDPARLEGEALRRWYVRSPAEIEDERRRAVDATYRAYFFPRSQSAPAERDTAAEGAPGFDRDGYIWSQVGERRWKSSRAPVERPVGNNQARRLAAAPPTDFWDDWTPCNTLSCHGRPAPSAPPRGGGEAPLPPPYLPRVGGATGGSPQEPRREKHPQCEMQERQDRGICTQQPTEAAKAECHGSATRRRSWCDTHDGEIGFPGLFTTRRNDGRRWP